MIPSRSLFTITGSLVARKCNVPISISIETETLGTCAGRSKSKRAKRISKRYYKLKNHHSLMRWHDCGKGWKVEKLLRKLNMLKGKKEAKNIRHTQLSPNYDFLSSVTNLNNITSNCLHLVSYAIPIRVLLFRNDIRLAIQQDSSDSGGIGFSVFGIFWMTQKTAKAEGEEMRVRGKKNGKKELYFFL